MIMEYRSLNLTRVSDLLPALSGIVNEMQPFRKGRYLAGLWEDTLVSDLCWSTWDYFAISIAETPDLWPVRTTAWRAPTWSWASIEASIEYSDVMHIEEDARVLEVECLPANPDFSFGLAWGSLVIMGQVAIATIQHTFRRMPPRGEARLVYDLELKSGGSKGSQYYFLPDCDFRMADEKDGVGHGEIVYCLKMGRNSMRVYTLVLRCVDEADQMYKRVGVVTQQTNIEGFADWYNGVREESVMKIC